MIPARITIPTDVIAENNSTNQLGWSENYKDGSKMGVGMPEYVLLFRKPQTDKTKAMLDNRYTKSEKSIQRGRWQIDAHQTWRSNGHVLTLADDTTLLKGMDTGQIYNWYKTWSKEAPYDFEQHVAFNESAGR